MGLRSQAQRSGTVITQLGLGALLALALALFTPVTIPSIINIAVSMFLALKLSKRWSTRIPMLVGLSAVLSLGFRVPSLIAGDRDETRIDIATKTVIGPHDKLVLDFADEYLYYRRRTDPPSLGFHSDWKFGIVPLATVYERPESILAELGIAHSRTGPGSSVLRIRTNVHDGVMVVTADVLNGAQPVATYIHRVRKSYPLEEFDFYGRFKDGDWRPLFLYFTQNTFWVPRKELFAENHRPLRAFIQASLAQGGVSANGAPVTPQVDSLNSPAKARMATATFHVEAQLDGKDIPPNHWICEGEDAGQRFTVEGETIRWKDPQIPSILVPRSSVDGYLVFANAIICDVERNSFWLAAYHMEHVNLWKYRMDFNARSLHLEKWLRAEPPPEAKTRFRSMPRTTLFIGGIRGETADLYVVDTGKGISGRPTAENGYRIELNLNQ